MVDDRYDGSNFIVKQIFFCGGEKDEFDKWKNGLSDLSESRNRRRQQVQNDLKVKLMKKPSTVIRPHQSSY